MKTTFFKRPPPAAKSHISGFWAVMLFVLLHGNSYAQLFNNSVHTEYPFPTPPGTVGFTDHSFTYTMSHIAYMTTFPTPLPAPPYMPAPPPPAVPLSDLSIHCWDGTGGAPCGVGYLNTAAGAGTPPPAALIYDQGFIAYPPTVRNLEASLMQDEMGFNMFVWGTNAAWFVIVSYYNSAGPGGPGHYVDVYKWRQPLPNDLGGLVLQPGYPLQLSTIKNYTRISQDAHNTYGFCITWENPTPMPPGNGINFVYGYMNPAFAGPSISPPYLLPGTAGETSPDVAFTHNTGLNLQFLYYRKVGANMRITESTTPFVLGPAWPVPPIAAPVVNDVNLLPWPCPATNLKTRIDATDHWSDDWAYSYILPPACGAVNNDIYVRYNNAGVKTTYNLTNGTMLPLTPMRCDMDPAGVSYLNDWPVCSFDQTTNWLNVEWYTQYQFPPAGAPFYAPNIGGYVGLRMDNTGLVISPLDYLQVAEFATGSNTMASFSPTIASSRQNDRTDYQFVAFANQNTAGKYMVIKDRLWAWPTFRGPHSPNDFSSLYGGTTAAQNVVTTENSITAYPNPFVNKVSLDVSAGLLNEQLTVVVEDISGRVVDKIEAKGNMINASLSTVSSQLTSGMYLLKVQSASGDFNKVLKIEKLSSN